MRTLSTFILGGGGGGGGVGFDRFFIRLVLFCDGYIYIFFLYLCCSLVSFTRVSLCFSLVSFTLVHFRLSSRAFSSYLCFW